MERRHFKIIARALNDLRPLSHERGAPGWNHDTMVQWCESVRHFARVLQATNPRFNRERFAAACGLDETNNVRP